MWAQIPAELRERAQWLVAGVDKAPLGIDQHGRTYHGSVTDPRTWCSFGAAAQYAFEHELEIGYVISDTDPFCCIDLDWTDEDAQKRKGKPIDPSKWSTPADANRYNLIMQTFASYTERSVSGKGLHVWVRADIGEGRRRDGIEVYSQQRFIVCTGDRLSGLSPLIEDRQQLVELMLQDMMNSVDKRSPLGTLVELPQDPEEELCDDAFVFYLATNADNAVKFNELFCGRWEQYKFPSQSEADLALMSMFTFYSDINSQCRRLFRQSVLGQREKAIKNNRYLDYTLRLIRHRQAHEETNEQDKVNAMQLQANTLEQAEHVPLGSTQHTALPAPMPATVAAATLTTRPPTRDGALEYPPGFAGAVAEFIYGSAPRPVKQVAIVSALGLLAGIMGKAWHIPQSGLNLYIILIARSGVGKEAMHSGISAIIKASKSPMLQTFVQFSDFVSGPALVKYCAQNASFVNVAGEWGQKLKRLSRDDGSDTAMATLRTIMTNLYQKSGPQAIMGGLLYSNQDNKIDSVSGVAYSMIGETTPDTFYESLTESMMADGFLSRFTIVEYDGDRPDENLHQNLNPPQAVIDHITNLAAMAVSINGTSGAINSHSQRESLLVHRTDEASVIIKTFNTECDSQIRGSKDEAWRQMWNRASLKAQRIAALLGAADRPSYPCIMPEHIEWAVDLVRRDIAIMRSKIEKGDVGMGDHSRQRKLVNILTEYMKGSPAPGYKPNEKMRADNVVPSSYLQIRTSRLAVFSKNRLGATASLAQALREFTDAGWLKEIEKAKAMTDYNYRGKCYMIVDLPIHQAKE